MRNSKLLFALLLMLAACREVPDTPRLPSRKTPIPEATPQGPRGETSPAPPPVELQSIAPKLDEPHLIRFSTPGSVRWSLDLEDPITYIRWSPLAGLIVSAGRYAVNVTSQGANRFRSVAGKDHKLFALGEEEIVWSPAFGRIQQLLRWGRQGWLREWEGNVTGGKSDEVYLLDASTVAALGPDGKDRWRAAPEGLRKLKGPFICGDGMLFHGIRGLGGVAVRVTKRGSVMLETELERGAALIGAGPGCEPLVWKYGKVSLISPHGKSIWELSAHELPFVTSDSAGFVFVHFRADHPVRIEGLSYGGQRIWNTKLPISGRITSAKVILKDNLRANAVGLCLGVSSSCSRPGDNRGPFNALFIADGTGRFLTHIRHHQGHLGFVPFPNGGLVVASSSDENETDLTLRDAQNAILWQKVLPGRLSAGPYVGPSNEIYVGTCRGWDCKGPHLLTAVTGAVPEDDDADEDSGE